MLLGRYNAHFEASYQQRAISLFLKKKVSAHLQQAICEFIQSPARSRKVGVVGIGERLFVKTTPIKGLAAKLRVSFSLPRGDKGYDYALADLINSLNIAQSTIAAPRIVGYGYRRHWGLVTELCIVHEYLEGHIDAALWLKKHPSQAPALIRQVHQLIQAMHQQNRYHLDLWLGNIMLPEEGVRELKVIDFEHYIAGQPKVAEALLGFLVGYFYAIDLHRSISEAEYDALTFTGVFSPYEHCSRFNAGFALGKANALSRKARRLLFKGQYAQMTPTA